MFRNPQPKKGVKDKTLETYKESLPIHLQESELNHSNEPLNLAGLGGDDSEDA